MWKYYSILGISIVLAGSLLSCNKTRVDPFKTGHFIYINNTSSNIEMDLYNLDDNRFKEYSIDVGDSLEIILSGSPGPKVFVFDETANMTGDSVVVINNNNCLFFTEDKPEDKSIFNLTSYDNYSSELVNKPDFTLYYTFSNEDFSKADSCK